MLPCVVPFCLAFSIFACIAFLNKRLDHNGVQMDMIVTDVFVLHREDDHDERIVAVSLPAEAGGTAIWQVCDPEITLAAFPIGSKAKIVWHEGYFGYAWCEYVDRRFPQYQWQLEEYYKFWQTRSAVGQFSAGSPFRDEMRSWGIPVADVANLSELSDSARP